jgi:hypothetical protein
LTIKNTPEQRATKYATIPNDSAKKLSYKNQLRKVLLVIIPANPPFNYNPHFFHTPLFFAHRAIQ